MDSYISFIENNQSILFEAMIEENESRLSYRSIYDELNQSPIIRILIIRGFQRIKEEYKRGDHKGGGGRCISKGLTGNMNMKILEKYRTCHKPVSHYEDRTRSYYWCDQCGYLKKRKQFEVKGKKKIAKDGTYTQGISLCLPICNSCRVKRCKLNKRLRESL